MKINFLTASALIFIISHAAIAQALPTTIRGYKVYTANISVRSSASTNESFPQQKSKQSVALVTLGKPEIVDISLSGIALDIGATVAATGQSGNVDFLTFTDFRINGIAVEIEEYKHAFSFKKDLPVSLPNSARAFIGTLNLARAARRELIDAKKEWRVTGTVFVFGKFRKFGFNFKRVVPVKIDLNIPNPLQSIAKADR